MGTQRSLSETVARNVRATVKDQGRSVRWLATTTGIAERTLLRRMTGRSAWTTDELALIGKALGLDAEHTAALMRPKHARGVSI